MTTHGDPTAFPAWAADLRTQLDIYNNAGEANPPRGMEAWEAFRDDIDHLDYPRVMDVIEAVAEGLDVVGPTDMQYRLMHIGYLVIAALARHDHENLLFDLDEWDAGKRP